MLYKKNDNHKYEQDLVAVSSTVIPLTVYEASAALHGGTESPAAAAKFYNEEYKQAYLKHLQKKQRLRSEAAASAAAGADGDGAVADRLITGKNIMLYNTRPILKCLYFGSVHSKRVLADVRST